MKRSLVAIIAALAVVLSGIGVVVAERGHGGANLATARSTFTGSSATTSTPATALPSDATLPFVTTKAATVSGTAASSLAPDITALVADQSPTDLSGLWEGGDPTYWFVAGGPAEAAAVIAAKTGNRQMLSDATKTFTSLIARYHQPNGSYVSGTSPTDINTMFFTVDLGLATLAAKSILPAADVRAWSADVAGAATYLVTKGNLHWYTNGNIAIGNSLVMELAYRLTGDPTFAADYNQALAFAIAPPQPRWRGFGLIITKQPTAADGSNGAGYFAESGGGAPGFDANYTQLQLDQLTRLYLVNRSPEVLRLMNLLANQLLPRIDTTTWMLDTSGGTRHPQLDRHVPFDSASFDALAFYGGRTDLLGGVASQETTMERVFSGATHYWNPGQEADFGREAASFVLLGLPLAATPT